MTLFSIGSDEWLATAIGRPAFRLVINGDGKPAAEIGAALKAAPSFAYAKIPTDRIAAVQALQAEGFGIVDTNLIFRAPAAPIAAAAPEAIRAARPEDRPAVGDVAARSFRFSRFHLDPAFPTALANRIKREWVENYFAGKRGDAMVVAESEGRMVGFLQALRHDSALIIDLVAVSSEAARRGLARRMIAYLATGMDGTVPDSLLVGTQAANIASCRLYEALGFRLESSAYVMHRHQPANGYPTA